VIVADKAAKILQRGGVIAYPTEGVFGLGCLPQDIDAVERLLRIKQRDPSKGLILIAASASQFEGWIDLPETVRLPDPDPKRPITWIVPAGTRVAPAVRGNNTGIAVRITTNPIARSICDAVASPIVSTSANLSGRPVAANQYTLRREFGDRVDYVVPGCCGPSSGASEIRDLQSGAILRPRH
jgi:L-threonylcarbamoyladenylate synthase